MMINKKANEFFESIYKETILSCEQGILAPTSNEPNATVWLGLGIQMNCTQIKEEALDMLYQACVETKTKMINLK